MSASREDVHTMIMTPVDKFMKVLELLKSNEDNQTGLGVLTQCAFDIKQVMLKEFVQVSSNRQTMFTATDKQALSSSETVPGYNRTNP